CSSDLMTSWRIAYETAPAPNADLPSLASGATAIPGSPPPHETSRQLPRITVTSIFRSRHLQRMERLEPWSHTHRVMPGHRKSPPNHGAKNPLTERQRQDVAFAREK